MTTGTPSFFDSLIQAHLTPVLQANQPVNPFETGEIDFEEWLAPFEAKLAAIARDLCQRLYTVNAIGPDDLVQEARLAIWQATGRYNSSMGLGGFKHLCLTRARGAMIDYIRKMSRTPAASLNDHLEFDGDHGTEEREIADTSTPTRKTSLAMRRRILAALRRANLTQKERLAVMAWYSIDNADGYCYLPGNVMKRLHISKQALYHSKGRAVAKLAHTMGVQA